MARADRGKSGPVEHGRATYLLQALGWSPRDAVGVVLGVFVTLAIFAAGFCIVGGQIAANALAAGYYPTSVRATGVGWALGIGRVGAIVGPLIGGALLDMKWSAGEVFLMAAAAALCAALAAFSLSRLVGGSGEGAISPQEPIEPALNPSATGRA